MRVQIKENPYSCETCNKDFSHKNNTVIHMRIHTKDKTQSCEICNKAFSQKQNLMRHMKLCAQELPQPQAPHYCYILNVMLKTLDDDDSLACCCGGTSEAEIEAQSRCEILKRPRVEDEVLELHPVWLGGPSNS
ncbi:zinc finger protein 271-like [Penaeus monodon]|uniref:zinc finger protein 271-like n=1 Tax=Penaeus monodon TaxID=6687 RepID=UPI0018A70FC3|nr:zinc finger protein 271-like [Penaeus monodon]